MKQVQIRLRKLEQGRPRKEDGERIREVVCALTLDEARFCLWVLCWEDGEIDNPTGNPVPTKEDEKRAATLLKLPSLKSRR